MLLSAHCSLYHSPFSSYFTMFTNERAYTAALLHGRNIHSEHVTQNLFKHLIEAMPHIIIINVTKIFFDS